MIQTLHPRVFNIIKGFHSFDLDMLAKFLDNQLLCTNNEMNMPYATVINLTPCNTTYSFIIYISLSCAVFYNRQIYNASEERYFSYKNSNPLLLE